MFHYFMRVSSHGFRESVRMLMLKQHSFFQQRNVLTSE